MRITRRNIGLINSDSADSEFKSRQRRIEYLTERERLSETPAYIRREKARKNSQNITNAQKELYVTLLQKLNKEAEVLENLILHDLGLDEDINKPLTLAEMQEVFDYYSTMGLSALKKAFPKEKIEEFGIQELTPYSKLFKDLSSKRVEFLIFAPADRLLTSVQYTKVKDPELQVALARHMYKCGIFDKYENRKKLKNMYELVLNDTSNDLGV